MRFALRKQKKIREQLGQELLDRILLSLQKAFEHYGDMIDSQIEEVEGYPYPILTVDDAGHTFNLVSFFVIRKQYDVYTVAFREFIG